MMNINFDLLLLLTCFFLLFIISFILFINLNSILLKGNNNLLNELESLQKKVNSLKDLEIRKIDNFYNRKMFFLEEENRFKVNFISNEKIKYNNEKSIIENSYSDRNKKEIYIIECQLKEEIDSVFLSKNVINSIKNL
jgi:hypothetical protein